MIELAIGHYLLEIDGKAELGYVETHKEELQQIYKHLKVAVIIVE